jgi:cytochrome c-type biogenesis protein CcmH
MSARSLIIVALVVTALALAWAARPQPVGDAERVDRIAAELRCPVCQGLSVKDSSSETARAMRDLVAKRVAEGRTDDQIRDEFRSSYGDWVLLAPPFLSANALVWLAPAAAIAIGALLAWKRTRAPAIAVVAPTPAERAALEALAAADEP